MGHRPDCGEYQLDFPVHDISETGALLETKGPVPIGTKLNMELALGAMRVRVEARIDRVQEPAWMEASGVAVEFDEIGDPERLPPTPVSW